MKTNKKILLTFGIIILLIAIFYSTPIYENYKNNKKEIQEVKIITKELQKINEIGKGNYEPSIPSWKPPHHKPPHHKPPRCPHHRPSDDRNNKCPDMDKYIRKTEIPSCISDFKTKCNRKQGKFIRKTKIPGCPRVLDSNKYILKTSIQPNNSTKHKQKHKIDGIIRNRIIDSVIDNNNFSTRHRNTGHSNYLQSSGLFPTDQCKFIDHSVKSSNIFNKI